MADGGAVFKAYDYIESGARLDIELTVGEYLTIDAKPYRFERIYGVTYEGFPKDTSIAIAEIISDQTVMIVSSAPPGSEWLGKKVKGIAYINGLSYYEKENRVVVIPPFWYYLLTDTIRLINDHDNNLAIITCATAFESFLSEFIAIKLHKSETWKGVGNDREFRSFRDKFLVGPDSLGMNDKIALFIKGWLGIQFKETTYNDWDGNVRSRRNVLVHAISKQQYTTGDAIKALRATCLLIYEILTLDADEELLKNGYSDDLQHFIKASDDSLGQLEKAKA
jgi:hypothetical protein